MCQCWIHRYHICHVDPKTGEIYDHSQGTWNMMRHRPQIADRLVDVPTALFAHDMTGPDLLAVFERTKPHD